MNNQLNRTAIKQEFTTVEVLGAEQVFRRSYLEYYGYSNDEEFFVSANTLNSASSANGEPLDIEGSRLSHLYLQNNGMIISVCYDDDENEKYFRTEVDSGFFELEDYVPEFNKEAI